MGIGRFDQNTHKFDLLLSIQYNASAAKQKDWQDTFQRASQLLYDATDGKHQLGTVFVCLNCLGGNAADAWILDTAGTAHSAANFPPPLGSPGIHITFNDDELFQPLVLVHEFGHHLYGLRDEYIAGGGAPGVCRGHNAHTFLANDVACIMEADQTDGDQYDPTNQSWTRGQISEFCGSANHTPNNEQQSINLQSCWGTMAGGYPDLSPAPASPIQAPPAAARINWVVLDQSQRFVLLLDRSASMAGPKLAQAKFGANWWTDALLPSDALSVVSFTNTPTVNYAMHTIVNDAERIAAHAAINSIVAQGSASIGGGLRAALDQIVNFGPRAVTECIVLLSTGQQDPAGEHPNSVLPALIARGVRVHTIGIHPVRNASLLRNIATKTGGTYYVA